MPRRDQHFEIDVEQNKHTSTDKPLQLKEIRVIVIIMHMRGSRTHSSDIALSELAEVVESVEKGIKDDGMYSTSSAWRLGPLATQETCLYY